MITSSSAMGCHLPHAAMRQYMPARKEGFMPMRRAGTPVQFDAGFPQKVASVPVLRKGSGEPGQAHRQRQRMMAIADSERHPAVLDGCDDGLRAVLDFHFLQNAADVVLDGFLADEQVLPDHLVALAFRH